MGEHAFLSPSAASRWLNCTAAPRLESAVPDKTSEYAEEGTLAHAICAMKLKQFLHLPTGREEKEIAGLREKYYQPEMDEHTGLYRDLVVRKLTDARKGTPDAVLIVERRLDLAAFAPGAFGTADAIIIADGLMEVIDFKYGKGVKVQAKENPQMMIYALGACEAFGGEYDIREVRMTIVQPRLDAVGEYTMETGSLYRWAETVLKPKAAEAMRGDGVQNPGGWCRFCKVKPVCRACAEMCLHAAEQAPDPRLAGKEEIEAHILPRLPMFRAWLAAVEEYTLRQALEGTEYKGFKVVEGRSVRKFGDPAGASLVLQEAGYDRETIFTQPELKSVSALEKIIGKKRFAELCGPFVVKPQGKPVLAADDDRRPAFNAAADDFKDI